MGERLSLLPTNFVGGICAEADLVSWAAIESVLPTLLDLETPECFPSVVGDPSCKEPVVLPSGRPETLSVEVLDASSAEAVSLPSTEVAPVLRKLLESEVLKGVPNPVGVPFRVESIALPCG